MKQSVRDFYKIEYSKEWNAGGIYGYFPSNKDINRRLGIEHGPSYIESIWTYITNFFKK